MSVRRIFFPLVLGTLLLAVLVSFTLGRYPIGIGQILRFLADQLHRGGGMGARKTFTLDTVIVHIRMPRIMGALLAGAALSVSGAVLQAVFVNPLVSSKLLGILQGASFGAALATVLSLGWVAVQASACLFGIVGILVALGIAGLYRGDRILMLVIGGIISSELFNALFFLMKYLADPYSQLPFLNNWEMGGFALANAGTVLTVSFPILAGIFLAIFLAPYLNVLTMGEEEARSMGIHASALRTLFIGISALISSLTVAMCGPLGWIGLVVPHMVRMLLGPDNRLLLPASAITGAIFLLIVDDLSRVLFQVEIPLGILTALVGVPVFVLILKNARKGWSQWS